MVIFIGIKYPRPYRNGDIYTEDGEERCLLCARPYKRQEAGQIGGFMQIYPAKTIQRTKCPTCNVDRGTVLEMLRDDRHSDNYWLAQAILKNCKSCKDYFTRR